MAPQPGSARRFLVKNRAALVIRPAVPTDAEALVQVYLDSARHHVASLIEFAFAWARERGCEMLTLDTSTINVGAIRLYQSTDSRRMEWPFAAA